MYISKFTRGIIIVLCAFKQLGISPWLVGYSEPTRENLAFNKGWIFLVTHPRISLKAPNLTESDTIFLQKLPISFNGREILQILREQRQKHLLFLELLGIQSDLFESLLLSIEKFLWHPIFALKLKWNRCRPIEMLKLPYLGERPQYGSYPCGTALEGYIFAHILGHLYPSKKAELFTLAEQIAQHRVQCGYNFPSDVEYAVELSQELSQEILKVFKAELNQLAETHKLPIPSTRMPCITEETLRYTEKLFSEIISDFQRISEKVLILRINKPIRINETFYAHDWRLLLDLIAYENDLKILETATQLTILEKIK